MEAPDRSVPRWVARFGAALAEPAWRHLPLPGDPPLTRSTVATIAQQMTVDDSKARKELGYDPPVSREEGLAELRAAAASG